jgi:hypothetical protein
MDTRGTPASDSARLAVRSIALFGERFGTSLGGAFFESPLLTAVGLAACYIPARGDHEIDPLVALAYE